MFAPSRRDRYLNRSLLFKLMFCSTRGGGGTKIGSEVETVRPALVCGPRADRQPAYVLLWLSKSSPQNSNHRGF